MNIATLKRAAEILSPATTAPVAPPCASRKPGGYAGLVAAMLEVLRDAPASLTAAEVGSLAMERTGQDPGSISCSTPTSKALMALNRYPKRGTVQRIEEADEPLRWRVAH